MKKFLVVLLLLLNCSSNKTNSLFAQNKKKVIKKTITKKPTASKKITKIISTPVILSNDENPYYIVVDKSDYELKVYDSLGWLATYPIVFGSKDLSDKMFQGDKKTPYGKFKIILKKIHKEWGPELLLNYPLPEDRTKFAQRKAAGIIPASKKIGGGIAIHATRKGEEWTIDNYYNWTDGCVSVKYTEMLELYDLIPLGTEVTIVD